MNAETKIKAGSLHSAMALAFAEIEGATKAATNPAFKAGGKVSKYADLGAVIAAIKPPLIAHGLFVTQHPAPSDRGVTVETVLHHSSGESVSLGSLFVPANKQDAHGFGSALTYCRRYALVTAFCVPVEDDDGNAAVAAGSEPVAVADAPPEMVADADRDLILTLAEAAGKDIKAICDAYKVNNLTQLTAKQGAAVIAKLQSLAKEKVDA